MIYRIIAGNKTIWTGRPVGVSGGLSPHRQGNHDVAHRAGVLVGSIPAQAGEPLWVSEERSAGTVYPRTGGGTPSLTSRQPLIGGLSPHRRGNLGSFRAGYVRCRSIPAQAGEPRPRSWRLADRWVYPRTGGGTAAESVAWALESGLSPHRRGNQMVRQAARE